MILYPAIDLKDGQCVRLYQGDMDQSTIFADNPASQATQFQDEGAEWLHLVDLNGAFEGKSVNAASIHSILNTVTIPAQLGGGIRDLGMIEHWIKAGVKRIILGTIAAQNPDFVKEAAKEFKNAIAVGIDARKGSVAIEGWSKLSDISAIDLAHKFEDAGVAAIIYTDIDRDGAMKGPNIEATAELSKDVTLPIIASGGVSSLSDLKNLHQNAPDLNGVIVGRALYEKKFTIKEGMAALC